MKNLILAVITVATVTSHASVYEKDRGGAVVPYAEGSASVMLSRRHVESLITIEGNAAELLFNALNVDAERNSDPFARNGQDVVKEKDNVKCVTSSVEPRSYSCLIRVQN